MRRSMTGVPSARCVFRVYRTLSSSYVTSPALTELLITKAEESEDSIHNKVTTFNAFLNRLRDRVCDSACEGWRAKQHIRQGKSQGKSITTIETGQRSSPGEKETIPAVFSAKEFQSNSCDIGLQTMA
jgi:hypothetical protein